MHSALAIHTGDSEATAVSVSMFKLSSKRRFGGPIFKNWFPMNLALIGKQPLVASNSDLRN